LISYHQSLLWKRLLLAQKMLFWKKNLNKNDVLCELNGLFKHYRGNEVSEEQITDIDVKTLTYIRTARNKSHLATSS